MHYSTEFSNNFLNKITAYLKARTFDLQNSWEYYLWVFQNVQVFFQFEVKKRLWNFTIIMIRKDFLTSKLLTGFYSERKMMASNSLFYQSAFLSQLTFWKLQILIKINLREKGRKVVEFTFNWSFEILKLVAYKSEVSFEWLGRYLAFVTCLPWTMSPLPVRKAILYLFAQPSPSTRDLRDDKPLTSILAVCTNIPNWVRNIFSDSHFG